MTSATAIEANPGKHLLISLDGDTFARYPISTHVITDQDDIVQVCVEYVESRLMQNDILFISERVVAISQGRAFKIEDIKSSWLAKTLSRYVFKSPYGIGLGSEFTMQLAIEEAGVFRILFAAAMAAMTKPFGIKGIFYHIVGNNINAIDGPCAYTLPPYNRYAKLGPSHPNKVAKAIAKHSVTKLLSLMPMILA
jgi:F420-0:gamma-glutamyl ligase-like protein